MKRIAGNQGMVKENNQKMIIDTLMDKGATSRAELAKILKLSAPSVSNNVSELLKKNILLEVGEGKSIGGRRPILLEFNYGYGYIIAIDLSGVYLKIALGNLKSEIVDMKALCISNIHNEIDIIDKIVINIRNILIKNNIKEDKLLAITAGFPGIMDEKTGNLQVPTEWLDILGEVNIKDGIEKYFDTKVMIKNDINLAALGEHCYGSTRYYRNLAYVSVDMGVGAGIILNNKLYEGRRFAAGEIGYFSTRMKDIHYNNKNFGPLESRISILALIKRAKKDMKNGEYSKIIELVEGNIEKIDFEIIEKAIEKKDTYILQVMEEITNELAIVLSNISVLLDLELIIIGGKLMDLPYDFVTPLHEITNRLAPLGMKIKYSSLEQKVVIYGAFAVSLEYVLNNILNM